MKRVYTRLFDLALASLGIVALGPIFLFVAAAIVMTDGRPIFFRQQRLGRDFKPFDIFKFRTMTIDPRQYAARDTHTPDNARVTRVGGFLRAWSLDELPSLFNVLKGDMSIVGPRPLLVHYRELYYDDQSRRHEVRPGITGLAQISGRNAVSWEDRFKLDVEYVDSRSLFLDLSILAKTVLVVLRRDGIGSGSDKTGEPFRGKVLPSDQLGGST